MPARKPAAIKDRLGTLRKSRERPVSATLTTLSRAPAPPAYLSAQARVEWRRIAPEAVRVGVTTADLRALGLLAEALATEAELRELIASQGVTTLGGSGGRKAHPALAALGQTRQAAHRLMSDFGLVPRGRVGMPDPPKDPGRNPFGNIGRRP